jgi:hypothetical protein
MNIHKRSVTGRFFDAQRIFSEQITAEAPERLAIHRFIMVK